VRHPTKQIKGSKSISLEGKTIVLGITGSIAAVKCVELARELIRHGAEMHAVMTKEAAKILHPNAMHYATGNPVVTELTGKVEHVQFCGLGGQADLLLIAPCTANTIGKIAAGIDDTTVTSFATTALGSKKKILIVPTMHGSMYENQFVKENLAKLEQEGITTVEPKQEENAAKFPDIEETVLECERTLSKGLLKGKKVMVASGATEEDIDSIRILTNRASGKTGRAIAKECYRQKAEVCIAHNQKSIAAKIKNLQARTGKEMHERVLTELKKGYDLYISPAALTDLSFEKASGKISSEKPIQLSLKPRPKLVNLVRKQFPKMEIVAFKAEVGMPEEEMIKKAREKMKELGSKLLIANDVREKGMGTDENTVLIVSEKETKKVSGQKETIAKQIVEEIAKNSRV
jgi:phosphopantothenoylcysteine decarboxylase/phosphopantothenate--cysteine ligase